MIRLTDSDIKRRLDEAVLAERKRCADICQEYLDRANRYGGFSKEWQACCKYIKGKVNLELSEDE